MFRTRSRFSRRSRHPANPRLRLYAAAGGLVLLLVGFFALVRVGDGAAPEPREIRIELPDALGAS